MTEKEMAGVEEGEEALGVVAFLVAIGLLAVAAGMMTVDLSTFGIDRHLHVDETFRHLDVVGDHFTTTGAVALTGQTTVIRDHSLHLLAGLAHRHGGSEIGHLEQEGHHHRIDRVPVHANGGDHLHGVLQDALPVLEEGHYHTVRAQGLLSEENRPCLQDEVAHEAVVVALDVPLAPRKPYLVCHPSARLLVQAQYLPRETPEPRYAPARSTADAQVEELELGQVEPEVAVRDEPMDVEPVKQEEDMATAAAAESIDPALTREPAVKPSDSPVRSPYKRRSPSPAPSMAVDEQKQNVHEPSPARSSPAPVKAEPIHPLAKPEVKAEPSIPSRPRRLFTDRPPSRERIKVERASPVPRSEAKHHWRGDRHDYGQSSPTTSHHILPHVKGSPHSPRPPFKAEERPHEHSKLSSAAHTPSIPTQELGGSATHSPRPHFDALQLERAISNSEPSHSHKSSFMRMGPRTEHSNGPPHGRPPYAQRESTYNQQNEQAPLESIYNAADLAEFERKHKQRMVLERESLSVSRQWYTTKHELDLALFDLRSAQTRTKLAEDMLDLAKAGKLGINYPSPLSAAWNEDVAMY